MQAADRRRKSQQTSTRRCAPRESRAPAEAQIRDAGGRSRFLDLAASWCNQGSRSRPNRRGLAQSRLVFSCSLCRPARREKGHCRPARSRMPEPETARKGKETARRGKETARRGKETAGGGKQYRKGARP